MCEESKILAFSALFVYLCHFTQNVNARQYVKHTKKIKMHIQSTCACKESNTGRKWTRRRCTRISTGRIPLPQDAVLDFQRETKATGALTICLTFGQIKLR